MPLKVGCWLREHAGRENVLEGTEREKREEIVKERRQTREVGTFVGTSLSFLFLHPVTSTPRKLSFMLADSKGYEWLVQATFKASCFMPFPPGLLSEDGSLPAEVTSHRHRALASDRPGLDSHSATLVSQTQLHAPSVCRLNEPMDTTLRKGPGCHSGSVHWSL